MVLKLFQNPLATIKVIIPKARTNKEVRVNSFIIDSIPILVKLGQVLGS
jgi:hypothetical protein